MLDRRFSGNVGYLRLQLRQFRQGLIHYYAVLANKVAALCCGLCGRLRERPTICYRERMKIFFMGLPFSLARYLGGPHYVSRSRKHQVSSAQPVRQMWLLSPALLDYSTQSAARVETAIEGTRQRRSLPKYSDLGMRRQNALTRYNANTSTSMHQIL